MRRDERPDVPMSHNMSVTFIISHKIYIQADLSS